MDDMTVTAIIYMECFGLSSHSGLASLKPFKMN